MKPRTAVATLISYGFSNKEIKKTLLHREPLEALEFMKGSRPKILERAEKIDEIIKNKLQEKFYPICYKDKYWPKSLKVIKDEPVLLWGKGDIRKLEGQVNIAVIGTRKPSEYSIEMEKRILKILLEQKCNIISGDSRLVIDYWSLGRFHESNLELDTISYINKVILLRKEFEKNKGIVKHISGDINPADLGFHK